MTIDECDYVVAARFRDFDQHSTRASKVVKDILETKDQWEHVRLRARIDSDTGCPLVAYGIWVAPARGGTLRLPNVSSMERGVALARVGFIHSRPGATTFISCEITLFAVHRLFMWTREGGLGLCCPNDLSVRVNKLPLCPAFAYALLLGLAGANTQVAGSRVF